MKKRYLVIGLYMYICYCMVAQYPNVPVVDNPTPATLAPQIRIGTPDMPSVYPFPGKSRPGNPQSYDRARTSYDIIQENHRELEREMQRQYYIMSLAGRGFPSRSRIPGTEYFYQAYEQLVGMLTDSVPIDLGKAVFLVENALLGNRLTKNRSRKGRRSVDGK